MNSRPTIAFIGAGNMANALIGGMLANGFEASNIIVADPYQPSVDKLLQQYDGVVAAASNVAAATAADVLILAVKPQVLRQAAAECQPALQSQRPLVISIVAGINSATILGWLGTTAAELPLVRCMPNTPALLQLGATGLYAGSSVNLQQRQLAEQILSAAGITAWVDEESALDAITAVSGSGPAYFFAVMEIMQNIALDMGLDETVARQFVQQTALGAAAMAQQSDVGVDELRRRVSSPGGTTLAALDQLEQGGLNSVFQRALEAARQRAFEMAEELSKE